MPRSRSGRKRASIDPDHSQLSLYMLLLLLSLTAIQALARDSTPNYCALCDPPGTHTACLYPPGPSPNCTGYIPLPLTNQEKITILDLHNRLRSRVARGYGKALNGSFASKTQPMAADMCELIWDDELEMLSQRWADQCITFYTTQPHDDCRDTIRFTVGQNIVTSAYSQPVALDVAARTMDWYNEISDYNPDWVGAFVLNPEPEKQIGHYTQLVWGWTTHLGCARAVFHEHFENANWTIERLVCNYAPSGNYLNFPVYTVGKPCSACPTGTTCSEKYGGLCKALEDPNERTLTQTEVVPMETTTKADRVQPSSLPLFPFYWSKVDVDESSLSNFRYNPNASL